MSAEEKKVFHNQMLRRRESQNNRLNEDRKEGEPDSTQN